MEFLETIAAPYSVYIAPVSTAYPGVSATPSGSWKLLGLNGTLDQSDNGVSLGFSQQISEHVPAGSTCPTKAFRTQEAVEVAFELADMTLETFAKIMDDADITTVPQSSGVP